MAAMALELDGVPLVRHFINEKFICSDDFAVPNYNPRDIVANIHRIMNGEEQVPMTPWYRGFTGDIIQNSKSSDKFIVCKFTVFHRAVSFPYAFRVPFFDRFVVASSK